ncbi:endodeoxyribonuclease protein [Rhizobium phage RHph_Y52]|nr:endodeoxyribonuclease protein [Rhizobium phage RHph_Y21]QIG76708.1 endodeoxyribonuclease protein [Rhizobium phage RHph_Y52]
MRDVSLDIETLGTKPGSIILSIGAVAFDPEDYNPERLWSGAYYRNISVLSSIMRGMTMDEESVKWWVDPERDAARAAFDSDELSLPDALREFAGWFGAVPGGVRHIYAKPPSFDCVLIEGAFRRANVPVPWGFRQPRCVRTVLDWSGFDAKTVPFNGTKHHALDDAIHQATVVQMAKAAMR